MLPARCHYVASMWLACFMHHDLISYLTISYPRLGAKVPLALFKRFRSFNAKKFGVCRSKGWKLPAVKVGGLKKKSASRPWPQSNQSARIRSRQARIIIKVWWLATLQPFDLQIPNFHHWKIYTHLKLCKISRGWQHFKGGFCPLNVTSFT